MRTLDFFWLVFLWFVDLLGFFVPVFLLRSVVCLFRRSVAWVKWELVWQGVEEKCCRGWVVQRGWWMYRCVG